ncbi:MAG: LemA family protein [Acutalibacteraceae bacterium]
MIILILIAALLILLLIWGAITYNRLITERLKVQTQWSQIDVVLKQRFDLIPNLVETVKGYATHENETLQAVTDARSLYLGAADTQGQMKASTELSGAVGRLMAVAESYPELKANQSFLHLQQQLSEMEEKLANYRQFYNDTVLRYDRLLETVPTNLIAKMFHFKKEVFFKVEEVEKAAVNIKF